MIGWKGKLPSSSSLFWVVMVGKERRFPMGASRCEDLVLQRLRDDRGLDEVSDSNQG